MFKVSVIIPVYNTGIYLEKILSDLICQTYKNIEIIVVDDGSTDNSKEIIDSFVKKDKRVIYIEGEHKGVSEARNQGLRASTGDLIRFCDSDDRVPENSIEELIRPMQEDGSVDLVIGAFNQEPKNRFFSESTLTGIVSKDAFNKDFSEHLLSYYYGVVWNKLYRKELIIDNGLLFKKDVSWAEDFLFNLDYYDKCNTFYYLDQKNYVYTYIQREDGSVQNLKNMDKDYKKKLDEIRYHSAKYFFNRNNINHDFEMEWNYTSLPHELEGLVIKKEINIINKYIKFKTTLQNTEVIEYIKKLENSNRINGRWVLIHKLSTKRKYLTLFIILYVKNLLKKISWLQKLWLYIRGNRAKSLY